MTEPSPPSPAAASDRDRLLDHEYDGIQEYDNPMPRWWVLLFWASALFAAGYWFHYHLSPNGQGMLAAYEADLKLADEETAKRALAEAVTEESLAKLLQEESMVVAGQAVFQQRCVTCHEAQGQGKIGPNLTDPYWIHGGQLLDIYGVIRDGVPAKGMIAWGKQLKPLELRQVTAYVGTLRGKNVAGKAPEGKAAPAP